MPPTYEIRADYDPESIVVYQAYPEAIAVPAVRSNRFVPPFSLHRMTWIKPSFLWLMERSNWGQKPGQQYILAVRITRTGWEEALSRAVLTHPQRRGPIPWRMASPDGLACDEGEWRQSRAKGNGSPG
jgi:hypothetical protein